MVNGNSVRKSFALLVLVALLAACSSSSVGTTPTAAAQPTLAAAPTEAHVTPTQPTATATVAPTSPATTTSAARPAILDVFPLSVGATWVYSVTVDDVMEYHWAGPVTETITAGKPQGLGWIFQSDVQGHPFRTQPVDRSQSYVVQNEHVYKVLGDRDPVEYVATEGQSFGVSQILVWPLSVGQKWGPAEFLARGDVYVWRVEAQESVSTPAGKFDGCYRLSFYWADSHQLAWFCPGTGTVRWETHHHGSRHDEVWELREFRPGGATPGAVSASPDAAHSNLPGGRLWLLRGDASPYELWAVRPDGTGAERLPMPGLELKDDVVPSPDGKSLLLIRSREPGRIAQRSLELYDLATGRSTILASAPLTGAGVQEVRWSPDGHDIAFTSDAQNGQSVFDIWLVSSDGQGLRSLTRFPATPTARLNGQMNWFAVPHAEAAGMVFSGAHTLQWSPDGSQIAFAYMADRRASPEIKVVRVSDGGLRSTAVPPGPYHFDEFTWTPDSQGLLYLERFGSGQARTWRVALDGTSPIPLADRPVIGPWSPDRKQMAFNVWPSGKLVSPEIWLYDYDTGVSRRLVQAADLDAADAARGQSGWSNSWLGTSTGSPWSPDGRWVAFIAQRDDRTEYTTWIVAVDHSELRKVADGESVAWLP